MDFAKVEMKDVGCVAQELNKSNDDAVWQLNDLQLAVVGGGIGDVVPA